MKDLSAKPRFDVLAALLKLDEDALSAIRHSINPLLPNLSDLAAMWDETLRSEPARAVFGPLTPQQREELQSRLASFVFRTISCVFDDDYCELAESFARDSSVPPRLIPVALGVAWEFVARNLSEKIEDRQKLADALCAWSRLIAVLREFALT
ncbi:MAG: hypothetical protein HS108_07570 [Planctomycetes bacterium]|jgi:hypothetical protein|nr:hypothetical protein [Planctomycetota bacterium]MCL4729453.1 hypothetical protein [Planctomycetota bacterium]